MNVRVTTDSHVHEGKPVASGQILTVRPALANRLVDAGLAVFIYDETLEDMASAGTQEAPE